MTFCGFVVIVCLGMFGYIRFLREDRKELGRLLEKENGLVDVYVRLAADHGLGFEASRRIKAWQELCARASSGWSAREWANHRKGWVFMGSTQGNRVAEKSKEL